MRALAVFLALAGFMLPAYGARRVTVAELEQTLAAAHSMRDAEVARQLSDLELTEQLSTAKLDRLETDLPGEKSRQALMILADASACLDPPAAEISNQPTPDVATQRKILALTVNYVTQTLHQLPNFFATRVTRSFEDTPAVQLEIGAGDINPNAAYLPIHLVGDSKATVSFRDGHEVLEKTKLDPLVRNLDTADVFGPILATVLVDAGRSKLDWSHWEQGPTGLQAVFSYRVPKEKSHYTLTYDSIPTYPACSTTPQIFSEVGAYHGEMAVDPASGTILRLILLADLKPDEFAPSTSGIEVEYGQVSIGGKPYFLPVRSVTSSLAHYLFILGAGGVDSYPCLAVTRSFQKSLNDVVFENYHVFRTDSRVLTESETANFEHHPPFAPDGNGSRQSEGANAPPLADTTPATSLPHSSSQAASSTGAAANSANPSAPEPQPAPPAPSNTANSAPPPFPVAASPASNLPPPPAPENTASSANSANIPVFRTTARQVLVDVIVDKKNGDPVPGLPQSDFSIAEDGKPRTIDFFEEHSATAPAPIAQPAMPPLPPGAVTNVPTATTSAALYILLLDSLNTEPQDQANVRDQVLSYLHKMDPGTQVAVFSLGSSLRLLQGFTSDPASLLAAVSDKVAKRDAMVQNRSDNADDVAHIANLQSMRASPAAIESRQAADAAAHANSFGARASMTHEALNVLARYLEGIPGRKNLVWFASSFPVVFFPTPTQLDQLKNNPNLPGYVNEVKQTANLFTLSKIAVYPVSGAGVMNSNIGMADSADAGSAGGTGHFGASESPTASLTGEALNFASATAGMEQLASSTGGRAFTTNDIDNALRKIVHDSDVYYTVGYAPTDTATDAGFRRIDVKVAGGKYKLAYRQGYNADTASTGGAPSEDPIAPLLQLGLPNATGIFYGVTAAPSADHGSEPAGQNARVKGPLTRYTISFTIRAQDVAFGQAPDGDRIAKLLIGVKAYGEDGSALNWQAHSEAAELDAAHYQSVLKSGIPVSLALDLPANASAQIVTAVYDWNTNLSGTLEFPFYH
jgi:VWFA-related protein